MTARTATQALAAATAALTSGRDVTDVLDRLVRDSAEVLGAQAVGLLVVAEDGNPELLSATSHQMTELELFQIQHETGPCIDAIRGGIPVSARSQADIRARWPLTGEVIIGSGYQSVHACPLRWRDRTLGAMNTFYRSARPATADSDLLARALADMATAVIVQAAGLTAEQITERVEQALQARTVIEQAKGVLAYTRDIDLADACDLMRRLGAEDRATITDTAASIISRAQNREQI
jgi:transcriptional regulator with GAF, ATPase, and Fis domain